MKLLEMKNHDEIGSLGFGQTRKRRLQVSDFSMILVTESRLTTTAYNPLKLAEVF